MNPASRFFVLRTPLLPLDLLGEWGAAVTAASSTDSATLPERLADDRARLRASYRTLLDDPIVREAIFLASPDLDRALEHWRSDPNGDRGQAAERALTRYLTRMASRPTPFGLFGATALGAVAGTTALSVAPASDCRRHVRLDMDYLVLLVDTLQRLDEVRTHLRYRPNRSLYRLADRWRLIETRLSGKARSHHLVAVERDEMLDATLCRAADGASLDALAAALVAPGLTRADADAYLREVIDGQLLEPDLACPVTGPEPLGVLAARLQAVPGAVHVATALDDAGRALAAIDRAPIGVDAGPYLDIARRLEALPATVELSRLFQVDMVRPAGATLGPDAMATIRRGVELAHALQPPAREGELDRLRDAWAERYEAREVPLAEALDADAGLGAVLDGGGRGSSPLLDGLDFPPAQRATVTWGTRERHLLDLVGRAVQAHQHELHLTDDDVRVLTTPNPAPLPNAYAAMVTLVRNGTRPPVVLMHGTTGPSGARLLGRFCHGDAALEARVREHLRAEEALDPDAVFAEIVHLPEGRVGNVILRPALRDYDIPFLGASGLPHDQQLAIDDLTVQLSGGRFVLRSRRLGRRVVPRLSCAHNFSMMAVGAYRFLCLVQADGQLESVGWDWGPLAALPVLPRVRVGDVVLARARWRLTRADVAAITKPESVARYAAVQEWRQQRHLPRWVVLADYDNALPVDLENVLAVESFVQLVKGRDEAVLVEHYPGPDELIARGPDGAGYAHELVVPFVREAVEPSAVAVASAPEASRPRAPRRAAALERRFAPGSEWIFAKLYGGSGVADQVLLDTVAPLSRRLLASGAIDGWFFLRYADPDEHLRWRLHVSDGTSPARVRTQVERATQGLLSAGLVRRVAFDTYEREVERYGGPQAMAIAERWFWADSESTVDTLEALSQPGAAPDDRWRAGALSVDRALSDLGCDLAAKVAVMSDLRERFGREFHVDAAFRRALAGKFRPFERPLADLLRRGPDRTSALAAVEAALTRRRTRTRAALARLIRLTSRGTTLATIQELAPSYVHMALNRLFRSEQRMHELVIYDFLLHIYRRQGERRAASQTP